MYHADPERRQSSGEGDTPYLRVAEYGGERVPATVDPRDWTVRVWDSVAGHYSAGPRLTRAQVVYACRVAWPRKWARATAAAKAGAC